MEKDSWYVLIDQIEKGEKVKYGDFVLVDADERTTFLRKVLFLLDMLSPVLFVLKRPFPVKVAENKLLIPASIMKEYLERVNRYASNYVWLVSFVRNTLSLLDRVEKQGFSLTIAERVELEGRLFLIQLHLLNKLINIYSKMLCKGVPLPRPLKPSYNVYLTSRIAREGLERVAEEHPFVKMYAVWKSMRQVGELIKGDENYATMYERERESLRKYYERFVAEFLRRIEQNPERAYAYGACLMLYSFISHLMWIAEWENYYTFSTREGT